MSDVLNNIGSQIESQVELPPIEKWNPPFSGSMDMIIKSNGDWVHEGGKINRHSLVVLFFSILRRELDGNFYLVTPVEKWRIQIEDAACIVTDMDVIDHGCATQKVAFSTNVDRQYILSEEYPLTVIIDPDNNEPRPYLDLAHGLRALLSRSVFYRLIELANEKNGRWSVLSDGVSFEIGDYDE